MLREKAIAVLRSNDLGAATKPAPNLYPHQWNWDSAYIAIGISHFDENRAQQEILSLLQGQWHNGMIPHIIFNPQADNYHPGPAFWDCAIVPESPKNIQTSGITQPPLLSYAVYEVFKNSENKEQAKEFLGNTFPKLKAYHRFFFAHRDAEKEGLAYIIHPWESGLDNSPRWDDILNRMSLEWDPYYKREDTKLIPSDQRPTDEEYNRYSYLVELFRKARYIQERIRERSPFVVQPILFNCIMCLSLYALEQIGDVLGEDTSEIKEWTLKVKNAINTKLWDEDSQMYGDYDLKGGQLIVNNTIASYAPLFVTIPSSERAKFMVSTLTSPQDYWPGNGYPLCSVSMRDAKTFNPVRYWRGPSWININWLMIKGLKAYGYEKEAENLVEKTLKLVHKSGFYEYFHPLTGEGCGANDFSWSASLIIDLIDEYKRE